jgi:hypothetical protein
MTYGRLDVHRPDGPIDSYQLEKTNVAIGRSPGNDITIDATAISRYHASITLRDTQVVLEDLGSVNGTYIDGRKLAPNDPVVLTGGEEIQIGELRLIFHPTDDSPTQPLSPLEATQRIEYEQPTYRVELVGPDQAVTPGVYVQAMLIIHNISPEKDRYFIELDGVPRPWVRLERVETALEPGEQTHLMISFKPLRKPDSAPGDYPFTVQVRSKSRPTQTVDVTMTLRVLAYSGFGIDLGQSTIASDDTLLIHTHNQGNAPLQLTLERWDKSDMLRFAFKQRKVLLNAGQRLTIPARVQLRRPQILGAPQEYEFAVVARAHDASGFQTPIAATFVSTPLLYGWRLGAAVGAVATALLVFVALLVMLLRPAPTPVITALSASTAELVAGDPLTLNWTVEDSRELYIELDGVPIDAVLTVDQTQAVFNIPTAGAHEVALVALNGDETARETLAIEVHPPLEIVNFSASPPAQVRYITLDVVLTWEVVGGTRVRLSGLPGEPADTTYSPNDSRLIALDGSVPLTITLRAEGGGGQAQEATISIPVVDPECTITALETDIRTGPSALHGVLGTVVQGQAVVPDRRDGSGQWLRVFANDEQRVWLAADALTCLNIDPTTLEVDSAPPTPIPTHTPTEEPTITPTITPTALPTATPPPTATTTTASDSAANGSKGAG